MPRTKSVIIVGFGSIGRRHARLLRQRGDLTVSVCESEVEALECGYEETGELPAYRSFEEALAAKPDVMLIATPHSLHADMTVRALEGGAHVLCEKPMSDNLNDARRMHDAAMRAVRVLNVGFHLHFHPGLRRLREMIHSGMLGNIVHAHAHVGSYVTLVHSRSRYQARMKGALLLDYAHQPDLLYWMLRKKPRGVYTAASQAGNMEPTANPNVLTTVCDYDAPMISTITLNYVQHPEQHDYRIVGDRAWVFWDGATGRIIVGSRETGTTHEETFATDRDRWYREEHQAFFDAVAGKRAPESPPEDAIVSIEVIEAAIKSWENRTRVSLD